MQSILGLVAVYMPKYPCRYVPTRYLGTVLNGSLILKHGVDL